jgi:hypothetical protein
MTASIQWKALLAGAATVALIGTAVAQSTPPAPASDPAVGAGQRSTQETPMGATGTPAGGAAGTAAPASTDAATAAPATSGSTTLGAGGATTNSGSSTMDSAPPARADRG